MAEEEKAYAFETAAVFQKALAIKTEWIEMSYPQTSRRDPFFVKLRTSGKRFSKILITILLNCFIFLDVSVSNGFARSEKKYASREEELKALESHREFLSESLKGMQDQELVAFIRKEVESTEKRINDLKNQDKKRGQA